MNGYEMVRIGSADSDQALRLSRDAGWNQTLADWQRLCVLEPEGCFGIRWSGQIVATACSVCYGTELAWIGMVLTDRKHRGRGLAGRLMKRCLEYLENRVGLVRLDATDMGKPLYASLGFRDKYPVERWLRPPAPVPGPAGKTAPFDRHAELDRTAFGADRSRLLEALSQVESAGCPSAGYAMGRPGALAAYFGPCVCTRPEAAKSLLLWYLAIHGHETVCWDLIPRNTEAVKLALEFGFEKARTLTRMERPGGSSAVPKESPERPEDVYALAGFEFG